MQEKHFEGERFKIRIQIESDANFSSNKALITDYEGYEKLKQLLEELDPPRSEY
jgi:hypothetical protein